MSTGAMFTLQRLIDLLQEPSERIIFPFAIDKGYVDVEYTQ